MNLFYFLLFLIVLVLVIAVVVLFGDLPSNRNTTLHKVHLYVTIDLPIRLQKHAKWLDLLLFNGRFTSPRFIKKIKWVLGWCIPVFYLIIMTTSLNMFFKYTFQQIKELEQSSSISNYYYLIIPLILSNYISFLLAVFSDPGYVDSCIISQFDRLSIQSKFPHDELIYATSKECTTCKIEKVPRSKHCSSCDRCVLMFDHHCIWLNNDVAYYTFRWFLLFLVSICATFIYGAYLCFHSIQLYVNTSSSIPNSNLFFLSKYWSIIKYTTFSNEVSGILFILCIMLLPVVGIFLCQILHSVYLGVSTNEIAKWNYIDYLIQNHLLYRFSSECGETVFLVLSDEQNNRRPKFIELSSGILFNNDIGGELKQIDEWKELENVYDKGFISNLVERIIPSTL